MHRLHSHCGPAPRHVHWHLRCRPRRHASRIGRSRCASRGFQATWAHLSAACQSGAWPGGGGGGLLDCGRSLPVSLCVAFLHVWFALLCRPGPCRRSFVVCRGSAPLRLQIQPPSLRLGPAPAERLCSAACPICITHSPTPYTQMLLSCPACLSGWGASATWPY